jgi:hypothetical protein
MNEHSNVVPLRQPDEIDDPLTTRQRVNRIVTDGAGRVTEVHLVA